MQEMQETYFWSLGWEDPLVEGMATHSSILPGKSHGQRSLADYSPWGYKNWTWLSDWTATKAFILDCVSKTHVLHGFLECDFGNRNFANVIKGCQVERFILNWPGGPNVNHISPQKRDTGRISPEDTVLTEAETGVMCFEDGGRGHKPRNRNPERGKETDPPSWRGSWL